MDENTQRINVDAGLYNELRKYCDRNGLRFAEFIDEALVTATHRDEWAILLRDEAELKQRLQEERSRALGEGFTKGVLAALLASQGNIEASKKHTPPEAMNLTVYRPVLGAQGNLFE